VSAERDVRTDRIDLEPGSFRDRAARVFYVGDTVYRGLSAAALADWEALARTEFFARFTAEGRLVRTERVSTPGLPGPAWAAVLRHDRIPFVSYPYEWSYAMLRDAALLQLDLLLSALDEDLTLKDASAFNIQFVGARPVFIDIASFTRLVPGEPWIGYRQFCQLYLYPLMLHAYKGVPFHAWLRGTLDGIEPEVFARLMSARDLLRPGVLTHVVVHGRMQHKYGGTNRDVKQDLQRAGFGKALVRANVARMRTLVAGLPSPAEASGWTSYATDNSYDQADDTAKVAFVAEAAARTHSRLVWDIGCNTGRYSRIAASHADCVVSSDADPAVVDALYRALGQEGVTNILPLVGNVANPSPGLGWRGAERRPLDARGRPDLVLCLALIHHLVISANLPLAEVIEWLHALGARLVIEFPTKDDPMVKRLLMQTTQRHEDYEVAAFETALGRRYTTERRVAVPSGTRILYDARPHA
jgi:SAM-dependent methyltransferase